MLHLFFRNSIFLPLAIFAKVYTPPYIFLKGEEKLLRTHTKNEDNKLMLKSTKNHFTHYYYYYDCCFLGGGAGKRRRKAKWNISNICNKKNFCLVIKTESQILRTIFTFLMFKWDYFNTHRNSFQSSMRYYLQEWKWHVDCFIFAPVIALFVSGEIKMI